MALNATNETIWTAAKNDFRKLFPADVYEMWFEPLSCETISENEAVLGVPNDFASIWIQDNYLDLITKQIRQYCGTVNKVSLRVTADDCGVEEELVTVEESVNTSVENRMAPPLEAERSPMAARVEGTSERPNAPVGMMLNPKYTFKTFVVGQGSQLAHAACIAVANAPARAYNPLFLYGETGLGKTHLMHAVAHQILQSNPKARIAYISSEKFTNEFISAIQENTVVKFRQRYRNVDALLIDDIHFLSGKESTQEEFFHTFNELFESQRQIFISSDRPASEIAKLESRLVSRFQWGLVTDIQTPDFETRLAILTKKADALEVELDPAILQFLAQRVSRNVRRMEGALTRVASFMTLTKQPVDITIVERLLQDILQEEAQNQVTVEKIQKKVVEYYHLRLSDMVSKRRPNNIAFPRQIAMYLSRLLTSHSLQEIGDAFGGRDHGTVIHACRTVENIMDQDETVKRSVDYLTKQLAGERP